MIHTFTKGKEIILDFQDAKRVNENELVLTGQLINGIDVGDTFSYCYNKKDATEHEIKHLTVLDISTEKLMSTKNDKIRGEIKFQISPADLFLIPLIKNNRIVLAQEDSKDARVMFTDIIELVDLNMDKFDVKYFEPRKDGMKNEPLCFGGRAMYNDFEDQVTTNFMWSENEQFTYQKGKVTIIKVFSKGGKRILAHGTNLYVQIEDHDGLFERDEKTKLGKFKSGGRSVYLGNRFKC